MALTVSESDFAPVRDWYSLLFQELAQGRALYYGGQLPSTGDFDRDTRRHQRYISQSVALKALAALPVVATLVFTRMGRQRYALSNWVRAPMLSAEDTRQTGTAVGRLLLEIGHAFMLGLSLTPKPDAAGVANFQEHSFIVNGDINGLISVSASYVESEYEQYQLNVLVNVNLVQLFNARPPRQSETSALNVLRARLTYVPRPSQSEAVPPASSFENTIDFRSDRTNTAPPDTFYELLEQLHVIYFGPQAAQITVLQLLDLVDERIENRLGVNERANSRFNYFYNLIETVPPITDVAEFIKTGFVNEVETAIAYELNRIGVEDDDLQVVNEANLAAAHILVTFLTSVQRLAWASSLSGAAFRQWAIDTYHFGYGRTMVRRIEAGVRTRTRAMHQERADILFQQIAISSVPSPVGNDENEAPEVINLLEESEEEAEEVEEEEEAFMLPAPRRRRLMTVPENPDDISVSSQTRSRGCLNVK